MGVNLLWHALAIGLTYLLVTSGFDWSYYLSMKQYFDVLIPAGPIGFLVPMALPLFAYAVSITRRSVHIRYFAYALLQADIIALFVAAFYKAITGRAHPELYSVGNLLDLTHEFHFGILERGVFWGWPSSHTTVAFALAAVVWVLLPKNNVFRVSMVLYALYIGIGVSATFHWFSDFAAGAIIGTLIGVVVGRSYKIAVGA